MHLLTFDMSRIACGADADQTYLGSGAITFEYEAVQARLLTTRNPAPYYSV